MTELVPLSDPFARLDWMLAQDPRLASVNTKDTYRLALRQFDSWRAGQPFSKLLVEQYSAQLQALGLAPNSVNLKLAAIRWFARRLADQVDEHQLPPGADYQEFERRRDELLRRLSRVAGIQNIKGERVRPGRAIRAGEIAALMQACAADPAPAGVRDGALIAIATLTGLRRAELVSLNVESFTSTEDSAEEGELLVRGKGNKERVAYIYHGAVYALADWLALRGYEPGPLFVAINKGGKIQAGHRLSVRALHDIFQKRARQAGVEKLTTHDFRRTFAGNLLDAGVDLATTQALLGHASPITTSLYDRRGERVRRQAVQKLFVPYPRRVG
jgi:site-specific recombinase XerD